jgi:DNA/RNA-binding domain of Phe-tRNA-synthetase-like protein
VDQKKNSVNFIVPVSSENNDSMEKSILIAMRKGGELIVPGLQKNIF